MEEESSQDTGEIFLREFFHRIILIKSRQIEVISEKEDVLEDLKMSIKPDLARDQRLINLNRLKSAKTSVMPVKRQTIPLQLKALQPVQRLQSRQVANIPKNPGQKPIDRVLSIFRDALVISVECTGPEKPIIVNKSGIMQTTNIVLTKEEIDGILKEISEKTKIPVFPGVFKVAFNNFLIIAVVSEFVGTRFTLQRKIEYKKI